MRIKVDEDLPPAVIQGLREAGHDAVGVVQQGMSGWKDPDLWQAVQREERFLVTSDKGFGDIRAHPSGTHAGSWSFGPIRMASDPSWSSHSWSWSGLASTTSRGSCRW